ncbi:MAG TPA: UDP-N-acetylglucosamine--N-acetylmuramyl-(pentapeptide) pyrophosphoryl-undecaprenol N-acetylglucosamine transferase [Gemmatimonadaceae bacterium]|nr:UDP-N-acetylglucosamine--N-acetylmuramyl-(pentapeptide) pyrophosphoryl-undecaprenol N-acetylglucosamine transferase [Gemmatimonadaceae bacterium]
MRIIIAGGGTGGHLYPGLAIARALVRLDSTITPFFIGARRGIERDVLPEAEFPFALLDLHPLYRKQPWNNWKTIRGAASAWRRLGEIIQAEHSDAVVGTGGYAAGLALAYAASHHIPLFVQEQNSYPGLTTRFFSRYAREVYLGYPEAERRMRHGRQTVFVDSGNPIQPPPNPRPSREAARTQWGFPERGGRVLLIYGGSQGSRALNAVVDAWVARGVPDDLYVIWATGRANFAECAHRDGGRVRVRPYLSPIAEAYAASDFALTRSGAMTTAELLAWGIPPVLVPLPTAAADHQTANAVALERAGAAMYVPQAGLTPEKLEGIVRELLASSERLAQMAAAGQKRARPGAAEEIAYRIVEACVGGGGDETPSA